MPTLSAFADEISADPIEQCQTLLDLDIRNIDLRAAWNTNVMELTKAQVCELRSVFRDNGMHVAAIASPIGKSRIDEDPQYEYDRLKKAADLAEWLNSGYIRIFSFYSPEGGDIKDHRDEVIQRLGTMADILKDWPVVAVHENESDIYGCLPETCLDIFQTIDNPRLRGAFDPANFVTEGVLDTFTSAWLPLKEYIEYIHLKDKDTATGQVVPCGRGHGQVDKILADAWHEHQFDGFMAMEPHLFHAGKMAGYSGPELFEKAVLAVRKICDANDIPLS